jgi:hypothetical protein
VVSDEAASILSRGGNVRVVMSLGSVLASVLAPMALALGGLSRIDGGPARTWPLFVLLVLVAIAAFTIQSRAFVTVTGGVLRWRTGFRTHEVSLLDVDRPVRSGGWTDRLIVPMRGRRPLSLWARSWGRPALDSVQQRLLYNARIGRPRARDLAR